MFFFNTDQVTCSELSMDFGLILYYNKNTPNNIRVTNSNKLCSNYFNLKLSWYTNLSNGVEQKACSHVLIAIIQ